MRVLVTRPDREAQRWVADLRQRGIDAHALPLLEIGLAPDADTVRGAWYRIGDFDAVMFVSGNAVDHFFQLRPAVNLGSIARAWAPGPGTRDALLQAGVPLESIDLPAEESEQFDSQALWQQVNDQLGFGQRVLVVRGGDADGNGAGRDWIAGQLAHKGVAVETVVAYVRTSPTWTPAQQALASDGAGDGSVWLFSSSESIHHLRSLLPSQDWSAARAIATHSRIAQSAEAAGFGVVRLSRPMLEAVVASIESMR
jgi:uroporphyrinogen-III synthase